MNQSTLRREIEAGIEAHRSGRYDEALERYRAALTITPGDAEANSLYGLALVHAGRVAEAEAPLRKAVDLEPDQAGFRMNLAELLERTGRPGEAMGELRAILDRDPSALRAWEKLADLNTGAGHYQEACNALRRARELRPDDRRLAARHAAIEASLGNLSTAAEIIDELAEDPTYVPVLAVRAAILTRQNRWPALEELSRAWIGAHPSDSDAWRYLSRACFEQGRYRQSLEAYGKVIESGTRTAGDLAVLGGIALHALDLEAARQTLVEAESLDSGHPQVLAGLGLLLTYQGRFEDAERYCRRCLEIDPEYVPVYSTLGRLLRGRFSRSEMETLAGIAAAPRVPVDYRIAAAYSLASGQDAAGDVDAAFASYSMAHGLARSRNEAEGRRYDPGRVDERHRRLMSLFPAPPARVDPGGDATPIFIVGMPRSGSTLVESVLGAHSRVWAGGERPVMMQILDACLGMLSRGATPAEVAGEYPAWRRAYLEECRPPAGATHFTDKAPLNFEAAGLIAHLFPAAVILNIRRNPVETGFSIYRNEFSKFWTFTDRLEDIGHYYGRYARLAAYWESVMGARFVTIQYEDFAADFAGAAPGLLSTCGLTWESRCLEFQQVNHAIATFSAVQARDPVTVRNGAALRYARHLEPLETALKEAGIDLSTGRLLGDAPGSAG